MSPFVLGIVCTFAIGLAASVYVWSVRRRQAELDAGLTALAAMRWRDFATLVLRMLKERGYSPIEQHPLGSGDQADFLVQRAGEQCVVSCKHGSAYHLNAGDLKELDNNIRLHDATCGKMVTAGQFTQDARAEAAKQHIELIDGATLWLEVAPLLPDAQLQHLQSIASAKSQREIGIAWLFAVLVGVAIAWLLSPRADEPVQVAAATPQLSVPQPAAISPTVGQAPPAAAPRSLPPQPQLVSPQQQESDQRQDALSAIKALPDVERALWSTQSTLSVFTLVDKEQPWTDICEVLDRYPAVRAVRVQLTPPAGSTSPVRFRQCYPY
ncbi:MAG: restriction endonuclease [Lysobacter sp.]|nr:restriction endonuclease [Lysobacter sp.]